MAAQFGQVQFRIWTDPDFLARSVEAQHLYLLLLSQEDRGPSGLIPLRPRRWAKLSADGSVEKIVKALHELDHASFLVVDFDTAEVLVRTFIRNDGLYRHVRLLRLALRQAERIESDRIRSAMGQELARLPAVVIPPATEKNAKAVEEAREAQRHLDVVISTLNDAPPDGFHPMGPSHDAIPWPHPPVAVAVAEVGVSPSLGEKAGERNARERRTR